MSKHRFCLQFGYGCCHAVDHCKPTLSDTVFWKRWNTLFRWCSLVAVVIGWILFMSLLPWNTVALTIVYIHVTLCYEYTFIILCNSCLCLACGILFNINVSTDFCVLSAFFFCSRMDFYCFKLIVLLQCCSLLSLTSDYFAVCSEVIK